MQKVLKISLLSVIAAASISSSVMAGEFSIGADVIKSEIDGSFNYEGTNVDLVDTLGMDQKETIVIPRISYSSGKKEIGVSYQQSTFSGMKTLSESIVFNNQTFTLADDVKSEISTKWLVLDLKYNMKDVISDRVDLTVGSQVHFINLKASLESSTASENYDISFAMPAFGLETKVDIYKGLSVGGSVYGMYFGSYGHYVEYDVKTTLETPVKGLSFNAGYKSKEFDLEIETTETFNMSWAGAYAGLAYKF